jgi:hypothetical protein
MRRLSLASVLLLPITLSAQEVLPAVPAEATPNKVVTESLLKSDSPSKPASPVAAPRRGLSPDTAAKLAAASPKFTPVEAVAPGSAAATESSPVLRDTDKPRNQIIRLPRFIVEEQKLHIPKEELQVLTPKGRVEYAFNRRPGLKFGPFSFLNAGIALAMLEEDLAVQRAAEMADLFSLYRITESPAGKK